MTSWRHRHDAEFLAGEARGLKGPDSKEARRPLHEWPTVKSAPAYNPAKRGPLTARLANDLSGTREQNRGLGGVSIRHTEYLSELKILGRGVYAEGTR